MRDLDGSMSKEKIRAFFLEWCKRGYNPVALDWLDWAKEGKIPARKGFSHGNRLAISATDRERSEPVFTPEQNEALERITNQRRARRERVAGHAGE
jgi:hypothetical protein